MGTARKNDIVAIEVEHTAQYAFGSGRGRESYTVYHLAHVEQASREGIVRYIRFCGQNHPVRAAMFGKVLTIEGEMQANAKRLAASITYPGRDFNTIEDLKEAVRNA